VQTTFWMEKEGFYALAIDGKKRRVESISSNPGHLLWCGLPRPDRARSVAERLLSDDLFSGWGLRTLSTANPAFNPLSYQLGSVWPHDSAIAASGLWRYGLFDLAEALLEGILHAAAAFEQHRLPELFCGFSREEGLPVPYEKANAPQSWCAAVPLLCVQLFLGIVPDAPRHRCYLSPRLPSWLPYLEVRNIRVGENEMDVRLRRDGELTKVEHLASPGLDIVFAIPHAPLWGRPA
jgi:glycogen debranching enzyme